MTSSSFIPVLIATVLANGCDDNEGGIESVAPPPIPASDVDFIDALVPHHEDAARMADETIARGGGLRRSRDGETDEDRPAA